VKPDETKEQYEQHMEDLKERARAISGPVTEAERDAYIQRTQTETPTRTAELEAKGYVGGVNLAQRIVLIAGFLIVLRMALFPSWLLVYKYPGLPQTERAAGYFLIFEQHAPQDRVALAALFGLPREQAEPRFFSLQIDRTRLAVQIGTTLVLVSILYLALRSAKRSNVH
jgi:hypothetical protein